MSSCWYIFLWLLHGYGVVCGEYHHHFPLEYLIFLLLIAISSFSRLLISFYLGERVFHDLFAFIYPSTGIVVGSGFGEKGVVVVLARSFFVFCFSFIGPEQRCSASPVLYEY